MWVCYCLTFNSGAYWADDFCGYALISHQFWATVGATLLGNALTVAWLYALFSIIRNERKSGPFTEQPFHVLALAAAVPLVMSLTIYLCVTI